MNRSLPPRTLTATVLAGLISIPALAQNDNGGLIDLDFPGGSAAAYIAAVRAATDDANIVETAHLDLVEVQPVELRRVSIHAALAFLQGEYQSADDRAVQLLLQETLTRNTLELPVFKIEARLRSPRTTTLQSAVWSLALITSNGLSAEHVLTAIEAGLDLFGDAYPSANLRYHEDTGLLLGRAHPSQIDTIHELLSELSRNSPGAQDRSKLEEREAEALQRVADLDETVSRYAVELTEAQQKHLEWQTRAELYISTINSLESNRETTAQDYRRQAMANAAEMADLKARIEMLKRGLDTPERQ